MKRQIFAMALLGALAGFSSCSEEEELTSLAPTQNGIQINAEIVGYEDPTHARTVIDNEGKVKWEEGDKLQIGFTSDSWIPKRRSTRADFNYQSGRFQTDSPNIFNQTTGEKNYLLASNLTSPALYIEWMELDPSEITGFSTSNHFRLPPAIQDDELPGKGIGKRDILTGFTTMTPTGENDVVNLKMKHLTTLLNFNIKNTTGQKFIVKSFTIQVPEGTVLSGDMQPTYVTDGQGNFVLDENGTYLFDLNSNFFHGHNIINETVKNGLETAHESNYVVSVLTFPFELAQNNQIEITVATSAGEFKHTYTVDKKLDFKAGALSTATVVVDKLEPYDENNVYIPDPALHEYLILNYDTDQNNKLSKSELDQITTLEIGGFYELESLEGIENLTNLESLNINGFKLAEADFTKNKKLTSLTFNGNPQTCHLNIQGLTSLKSLTLRSSSMKYLPLFKGIDLTELNNLESLSLINFNLSNLSLKALDKLNELCLINPSNLTLENLQVSKDIQSLTLTSISVSSLDVSKFTNLKTLNLQLIQNLTQLNYSGCTELRNLNVSNCRNMNNLDLSSVTKLETLKVEKCYSMTQLDVSKLTKLLSLEASQCNLKNINLSMNKELTYIDVNQNNDLETLDLSGHSKLTELCANNCKLTSLKLTGCSMLSNLFAAGNNFTEIDVSECNHDLGKDNQHILNVNNNPNLKTVYVWKGFTPGSSFFIPTGIDPIEKEQTTTPDTPAQ